MHAKRSAGTEKVLEYSRHAAGTKAARNNEAAQRSPKQPIAAQSTETQYWNTVKMHANPYGKTIEMYGKQ